MKFLLMACAVSALAASGFGQETARERQEARLSMAKDYLGLLKVPYANETLDRQYKEGLVTAFELWRKIPEEKLEVTTVPPSSLVPNRVDRILRVSSFKTDWAQTPQYVSGVPEGSPPNTPASIVRNPNYALWSFGGTISPSELYVSIGDRTGLCDAAASVWQSTRSLKCDKLEYLSASRKRDVWARFASAATLTVNTSQVPRFQSGVLVTQTTISHGRDYTFTLQGSFDPVLLFRSPAEWANWGDYYSRHSNDLNSIENERLHQPRPFGGNLGRLRPKECATLENPSTFSRACFERLSSGSKLQQTITTILPKIDVRAYTAFDFFKTGLNTFVPTPKSGRALYDITATWDLRKVIPSASARVQALKATKALTVPRKPPETLQSGWKAQLEMYYLDLVEQPGLALQEKWWNDFHDLIMKHL